MHILIYAEAMFFLCRGHVFANAQTGNIVLLGIKIANGEWRSVTYYLIPIIAFFLGIMIAAAIRRRYKFSQNIHWRQIIVAVEAVVLLGVAFIPQGDFDMLANTLISFVCSLQVESFRKMNGNDYSTTMCTGNLRSATEHLYDYRQTKDKKRLKNSLQYYGVILFFIVGAAVGSVCTGTFGLKSVLFGCGGLGVAFLLMYQKRPPIGNEAAPKIE